MAGARRSRRLRRHRGLRWVTTGVAFWVCFGLVAHVSAATTDLLPALDVHVLSNRADLVSGGDALVEVELPQRGRVPQGLSISLNGRDVTQRFDLRPNGDYLGVVSGLNTGRNSLVARAPGVRPAQITVTNHPIGGPIFAGEQIQPWGCTTQEHGLGPARDAQCNTPPVYEFFYRSVSKEDFLPYDPDDPPRARDVATTTTDEGHTVPYIVRRERGVIDRGIYDIAVLYDPGAPWEPWASQKAWNHKLFWAFGASCQPYHAQLPPDGRPDPTRFRGVLHHQALSRGFAVAGSGMTVMGNNCNSVVAAEALMMIKEHLIETYGPVRYTFGLGGSGGSIQQLQIAEAYPGLLDGIVTWSTFADLLTTVSETFDCRLLSRYFNVTSNQSWDADAVRSVLGHTSAKPCKVWITGYGFPAMFGDPTLGCTTPLRSYRETDAEGIVRSQPEAEWVYHPDDNPDGVRCTIFDYLGEIFGHRPGDGFARRPYDNVGVQYGLKALLDGEISPAQFADLNSRLGGLDIDYRFQSSRVEAGVEELAAAYRSGQVVSGEGLADVAILDASSPPADDGAHTAFHSWKLQERLLAANGSADNHVIRQGARERPAFNVMDRWLSRVEADTDPGSRAARVARNRPPLADKGVFHGTNPRIAAGAPLRDDVLKCRLKPLDRDDYPGVTFTDEQWSQLQWAFPDGVCDWTRPGLAQVPTVPWATYAGDGLDPLGPVPGFALTGDS